MSSPNYVKFGPAEMIVAFSTDRGEMRTNANGDYFFRGMVDRRFTCCSPDLERMLIDRGVRAGDEVGISKQTRNRITTWKIRPIHDSAGQEQRSHRTPLPSSKYAPPPPREAAPAPAPSKPVTRAPSSAPATPDLRMSSEMSLCMRAAIDSFAALRDYAQERGVEVEFHVDITGEHVQALASTLYIGLNKQSNIRMMNERYQTGSEARTNGGYHHA